jgi:hypothetical protein
VVMVWRGGPMLYARSLLATREQDMFSRELRHRKGSYGTTCASNAPRAGPVIAIWEGWAARGSCALSSASMQQLWCSCVYTDD